MQPATTSIRHAGDTLIRIVRWLQHKTVESLAFDIGLPDPLTGSSQDLHCGEGTTSQTFYGEDELLEAINVTRDSIVASRVSLAITSIERRRGLLGRTTMDPDEGLYIVPTQWIHMFGMRFPIDVAFLSPSGRVLSIHHDLKPNRLSRLVWRAEGALELPAGALQASHTEIGDTIEIRVLSSESRSRHVL
jgi:uncharacterized membrane protein (UPF0127 family)